MVHARKKILCIEDDREAAAPERRGPGASRQTPILQPVPTLAVPLVGPYRARGQQRALRSVA